MLLGVVDSDEKVAGFSRAKRVVSVGLQLAVQLQPADQYRRRGGAGNLQRRAVGQARFLLGNRGTRQRRHGGVLTRRLADKELPDRTTVTLTKLFFIVNGALSGQREHDAQPRSAFRFITAQEELRASFFNLGGSCKTFPTDPVTMHTDSHAEVSPRNGVKCTTGSEENQCFS